MSQEQIEQFYQLVKQDTILQKQLKTVDNLESGLKLVTELAKEKGYIFTATQLKEWMITKSLIDWENTEEELSEESFNLLYCHTRDCRTNCDCRKSCRPCRGCINEG